MQGLLPHPRPSGSAGPQAESRPSKPNPRPPPGPRLQGPPTRPPSSSCLGKCGEKLWSHRPAGEFSETDCLSLQSPCPSLSPGILRGQGQSGLSAPRVPSALNGGSSGLFMATPSFLLPRESLTPVPPRPPRDGSAAAPLLPRSWNPRWARRLGRGRQKRCPLPGEGPESDGWALAVLEAGRAILSCRASEMFLRRGQRSPPRPRASKPLAASKSPS